MDMSQIDGQRQYEFLEDFDYIREAGTPGEERAAAKIQEVLKLAGLESRQETFSFETFQIKEARLSITEPYEKEYRVTGYGRTGNTPPGGITAPFLYVENGDDLSLSFAKGKIVLLNSPVRKEMYQKLTRAGAVGFISICGTPLDEGPDLIPPSISLPSMEETPIQGVHVHYLDAVEMVTKGAKTARLLLTQETVNRTSRNVVAHLEGTDKAEEILTLTAHYDSVPAGPGAYDNMAGGAIILELCRYFKENRPRRSMEFIWFGAEEKGLLGSLNYVNTHEAELDRHQFNMNVDLAGQLVGGTVMGVTGDPSICSMLTMMAHEVGLGMTTKHQIWGSDSNSFAWKGVPAMTLNRDGFGMHTRHDTVSLLSPWSLKRSTCLLGHVAERLGNIEVIPFPRSIPEEFQTQLDHYFNR